MHLYRDRIEIIIDGPGAVLRPLVFVGSSPDVKLVGETPLPGVVHYLIGAPEAWRKNIPTYASVRYAGLYPGVDLLLTSQAGVLEARFSGDAGTPADGLLLHLDENLRLQQRVDEADALAAQRPGAHSPMEHQLSDHHSNEAQESAPRLETLDGNFVRIVPGTSHLRADSASPQESWSLRATIAAPALPEAIEPECGLRVALGADGSLYLAGTVPSLRPNDPADAYVARLTPDGSSLLSTVYLGGSGNDRVAALAVGRDGAVVIAGETGSTDFAGWTGGLAGLTDAFLVELNTDDRALRATTIIGGSGKDGARAIALDDDRVWIAGVTEGDGFPVTVGTKETNGGADGFLAAIDRNSGSVVSALRLGGSKDDAANAVVVDRAGRVHVAGVTGSPEFAPLRALAEDVGRHGPEIASPDGSTARRCGDCLEQGTVASLADPQAEPTSAPAAKDDADAFFATVDGRTGEMLRTRRLGGSADDEVLAIAASPDGGLAVAGRTASWDFPLRRPARSSLSGPADAFVARFDLESGDLIQSTYLGDLGDDRATSIAFDAEGRLWVAGTQTDPTADAQAARSSVASSASSPFPSLDESGASGGLGAFLRMLSPDGREVARPIHVGGEGSHTAASMTLISPDKAIVTGATTSTSGGGLTRIEAIAGGGKGYVTIQSPSTALTAGCPGTINFDNSAGTGLWQTAANWDTNTLPAPGDAVCIAGFAVTLSSGSHSVNSLTVDSAGSLAIFSSLDLASTSQIDGSLTVSGGTLSGAGNLTVNGTTSFSGHGLMTGTGRTKVAGGLILSGFGGHLNGGRVLEVPSGATVTMSGGLGNLFLDGPASVENSGTWNIAGDAFIAGVNDPANVFTNFASGALRKTAGTGVSEISGMKFNNTGGTVEVQSGELRPGRGTHTGPFLISAGTLNLNSITDFNAGSSVSGPGQFTVSGGTTSFNTGTSLSGPAQVTVSGGTASFNSGSSYTPGGMTQVAGPGTLNLDTGVSHTLTGLTLGGGTLSGADNIEVTGMANVSGHAYMIGTGRTKVTGGLLLTGLGGHLNGGRVLEVPSGATVTMTGGPTFNLGNLFLDGPASVENSGTWNIAGDAFISGVNDLSNVLTNFASGVLRKTGGTGVSEISGMRFNNTGGTVEVQSGELRPGRGTHTGPFLISAGTLNLNSITDFNAGSSMSGPGQVNVSAGTTSFNAGSSYAPGGLTQVAGTLNLNTGASPTLPGLTMTGGTLSGADNIDVTAMTDVSGYALMTGTGRTKVTGGMTMSYYAAHLEGGRVLEVPSGATVTMLGGLGNLFLTGPAAVENSGTWDFTGDQFIQGANDPTNVFTNFASGVLRKSGGTGTGLILSMPLNNMGGMVEALAGTLSVSSYTQTAGVTRADGATLSSPTAMSINGGSITGSGTISTPSVNSAAEVRPGDLQAGSLAISGAYTQQTAGRYRAQIGGLNAGTQYDQVNVTGNVTLGGELVIDLLNGFSPSIGDSFTLMTFASRGGTTFANFNPMPAPCGLAWNLVYTNTSVVAQVVAGPCPDADNDGRANCCHPQCFLVGGDVCGDCNDSDAGAFALPQEVNGLLLGANGTTLSWTSALPSAGPGTVHDVVSGLVSELPVGSGASETCLATTSATTTEDTRPPAASGTGRWYLVRGRNSCGSGTYGTNSDGQPHVTGACP